jgi:hypothetical protein
MALKYTLSYSQYINESEEVGTSSALTGYKADQIINRIKELMEVVSDRIRFGIPPDNLDRGTTYKTANEVILRINDILHYYNGKKEEVRFYCGSITYEGSWEATESLTQKISDAGGFGKEKNLDLKKVIAYFTENREDVDKLSKITIRIDSPSIRKDRLTQKEGEVEYTGGTQKAEPASTKEGQESTDSNESQPKAIEG